MERNIRDMARHVPVDDPYAPKRERIEHLTNIHKALTTMPPIQGEPVPNPIILESPLQLIANLTLRLTYAEMVRFAQGIKVEVDPAQSHVDPSKIHEWAKGYRDED